MTPSGTRVETEALRRFSAKAQASAEAIDALLGRLDGIDVGSLSFGQFPASRQFHEVYDEIAEECRKGMEATSEAFRTISAGVQEDADRYDATEDANRDMFSSGGAQ